MPEWVAASPTAFHDLLVAEQVSVLDQSPSAVGMLSPHGLESMALVVGGEACPAAVVDRWAGGRVMINAYGPTETTVDAVRSAPLKAGSGVPPIGSPVAGRRCSCWTAGCGRCRRGWWGVVCGGSRCRRWVLASRRVECVAVCGVPVWSGRFADVSHRGSGALGCRWAAGVSGARR
ncbi:AMP-binding enzyme family protein [Mycobacterium kansasii]|uniref:AMP-binding enzyme family protein n=1 Tax=Mycobacterium kansasii TaxID=1768 RepID=A0A1V3XVK1_MYCKA|nr:AMP-binding enzyme family protein [Mycobacterium kansasii]